MTPHRTKKHGSYLWLTRPAVDRAKHAGGNAGLLVYLGLCYLESRSPIKAGFFASIQNIANAAGVGTRTVTRALPVLIESRLVAVESGRRATTNGTFEASKYTLLGLGSPCATQANGEAEKDGSPCATESGLKDAHISVPLKGNNKENPLRSAAPASRAAGGGEEKKKRTPEDWGFYPNPKKEGAGQ